MSDATLLDNISWHALCGPHAHFAAGTEAIKRYAHGFSPILGFAQPSRPDFDALRAFVAPGEHFYCADWTGAAPPGWQIDADATMFQMVWSGALPEAGLAGDAVPLDAASHGAAALALAELTRPGPFGARTLELGEYLGLFDGDRLVAMAGERMTAGRWREVSGVCTHPAYQGRGLARRLMLELIRRQVQRGETPFLHVMRHNETAHALYLRMGFVDHRECPVRVVSPTG
ncbi:MAG TPA: GNAT family N-acetyltransferase [Burkholderiaceae bacterium]|nr:GNAT family N-acetyltransferase [Burkholderiaceae bacterium]